MISQIRVGRHQQHPHPTLIFGLLARPRMEVAGRRWRRSSSFGVGGSRFLFQLYQKSMSPPLARSFQPHARLIREIYRVGVPPIHAGHPFGHDLREE
jgi:Na+-driven multidrug efflux pump